MNHHTAAAAGFLQITNLQFFRSKRHYNHYYHHKLLSHRVSHEDKNSDSHLSFGSSAAEKIVIFIMNIRDFILKKQ